MPILQLLTWPFHMPRYFAGQLLAHAALLARWVSWSLDGLSDGLTGAGRYLCDLPPGEDFYESDGWDDDDDPPDDGNCPAPA